MICFSQFNAVPKFDSIPAMAQAQTSTTPVRRAVARVESVFRIPCFARMVDPAEHIAESHAIIIHIDSTPFRLRGAVPSVRN